MKLRNREAEYEEILAFLSLATIRGIGYWTLRRIAAEHKSFSRLVAMSQTEFTDTLRRYDGRHADVPQYGWDDWRRKVLQDGEDLYEQLAQSSVKVILFNSPQFPTSLKLIDDPPYWLFVRGDCEVLSSPSIAAVGTRSPSDDGIFLAKYVGASVRYFGVPIVSGLAAGIDQLIERSCVRFEVPTIAVLGTGILFEYPAATKGLRESICAQGGAIVTEYLPSQGYSAENFVRRNRLQAGLSKIVMPIEWKENSGTGHTVRYAKKENREIFCFRMPDWPKTKRELIYAQGLGAKIFTIPGDEKLFYDSVTYSMQHESQVRSQKMEGQLELWIDTGGRSSNG